MAKKKTVKEAVVKEEKKKAKEVEEVVEEVEEVVEKETTEVKEDKKSKKKEKKEKKQGFFKSIRKEMKQVVWPSGKDIFKSTIAVLVMCLSLSLFFAIIELLMALIKGMLS